MSSIERSGIALGIAAGFLLAGAPARAGDTITTLQGGSRSSAGSPRPRKLRTVEGITEYDLDNGLRVLLFPDQSKPTTTVNVTYFVGSRHEGYGETGMAHLLEHMLFKGTPRHPQVWKDLQDRGARFNGSTFYDRTNYFEVVPATPENLEFFLDLEADRMVNSKVAAEDLAKEFSVVRNEFEIGESNPEAVLEERMLSTAYLWHNYGKAPIGSRADIERIPVDRLQTFYRRYYQPDNAMLVLAGKFDPARTLELVRERFGAIPRPARQLAATYTLEPAQDGERAVTLRRTGDVAVAGVVYHGAAGADPDFVAEEAILDVLTNQPSGRLYKALVEKGLASEIGGGVYPVADPGVLFCTAKVRAGQPVEKVRDVMTTMFEGLGAAKIGEDEVARYRARALKDIDLSLTRSDAIGIELSEWAAMGDWRLFFLHRDRVKALTVADVARAARKFLKASNRTVGLFIPTKAPDRAPLEQKPDVLAMVKDYAGSAAASEGEVFASTAENVEKRTARFQLASGMKVALLPKQTRGHAVKLVLSIHFGREKDLQGKTTAAEIIPEMLMRGSKKHSFQKLKDELDRLKADVQLNREGFAATTPGEAFVRITTVRDNLPAVLDLVTEMLEQPAFPKAEFETLRKEALGKAEEERQNPIALAVTTLIQRVSPYDKSDVRYRPSIAESIERLKAVKLKDLASLHKQLWGGSYADLAVVGDFDAAATRKAIEAGIGRWRSGKPFARIEQPFKEAKPSEDLLDTPDKEMAFVGVAHTIEARDDEPDYPALILLNHLIGGSATSRLFERLRQKEGLSYGAFSAIQADSQDRNGVFFAGAICAPQNADKAMRALLDELDRLLKSGVGAEELADGKKSYVAMWDNQMANDDFVAAELASGLHLGRTFQFWKGVNAKIETLTPADLVTVARKYVQLARLAKVKAVDVKKRS